MRPCYPYISLNASVDKWLCLSLYLEPFLSRFPGINYGYLTELEYLSNSHFNPKDFDQSLAKEKAEATKQLQQYATDPRIAPVAQQVTVKKLVLIYKGWELVYAEEVCGHAPLP